MKIYFRDIDDDDMFEYLNEYDYVYQNDSYFEYKETDEESICVHEIDTSDGTFCCRITDGQWWVGLNHGCRVTLENGEYWIWHRRYIDGDDDQRLVNNEAAEQRQKFKAWINEHAFVSQFSKEDLETFEFIDETIPTL